MKFKPYLQSRIFLFLLLGLLLRLVLCFFGTLKLDFNTFVAWSNILAKNGFVGFYNGWSDYLPGYIYVLWFLGKCKVLLPWLPEVLLYKFPAILADVGTGFLIFKILKSLKLPKWAWWGAAFYLFNPAVLANSTFWGQVDSLTALFSLAAVYLAEFGPVGSAAAFSLGVLMKPQALLAAPAILLVALKNKWKPKDYLLGFGFSLLTFGLAFVPFAGSSNLVTFIYQRVITTLNQYPYTSVNAFSFWALGGMWEADGLGSLITGYLVMIIVIAGTFFKVRKRGGGQYFLLAAAFLVGFLFQTRMHERHLLPSLAPLVIAVGILPDLVLPYAVLSLTYIANLYYSYTWITRDFKTVFSGNVTKIFVLLNLFSLIFIIKNFISSEKETLLVRINRFISRLRIGAGIDRKQEKLPAVKLSDKKLKYLFWAVLGVALVARLAWLWDPPKEYFDEVYHAFTARIILHGDPKAWEWWNPHPEGFAYEWTHPPLAKLGMALGMKIFGENAFGWRFPGAILGAGCVLLVYGIAKELFKDELLAILSAGIFGLDGLALTMSRIGMNDIYLLFFVLLTIYYFLRKKNFLSALAFGLALASKWSAVWVVPILGVIWLKEIIQTKNSISTMHVHSAIVKVWELKWFVILPPLIYLATYLPMFLTGHGLDIFWGMQKQMWWYHTGLKATHPYTSAWWSWPFLVRPVYLYTSDEIGGVVARIYNLGNPVVFWFGLASVFASVYYAWIGRNKKLAMVVFSYLIFFVPWAASPRIMFFYHYLPSLPFLAIASGYLLRRSSPKLTIGVLAIGLLVFIYFYPHWAGLNIPLWWDKSYYWFSSWR